MSAFLPLGALSTDVKMCRMGRSMNTGVTSDGAGPVCSGLLLLVDMLTLFPATLSRICAAPPSSAAAPVAPVPQKLPLNVLRQILLPQQAGPADAPAMVPHGAQQPQAEPPQPLHSAAGVAQENAPQQPAAPHKAVDAEDSRVQLAALAKAEE